MRPCTRWRMLSVGMYGDTLPPQDGAPVRLMVPWKYGFKSVKSLVKIKLVEKQPPTTWNMANAHEYGFYSNVNPQVDHPRWSQASEQPPAVAVQEPPHPDVQRLRRPGGQPVRRHGPEEELLRVRTGATDMLRSRWTNCRYSCSAWHRSFWSYGEPRRRWPDRQSLEFITHFTGDWTIRFLVITLAVTPLRKLLALPDLIRFRRMFGLFAFFYGALPFPHLALAGQAFLLPEIAKDVAKRPFITAGFTGWCSCCPWRSPPPRVGFAGSAAGAGKCCIAWSISPPLPA